MTYTFAGCTVDVNDDTQVVVTRFPDGTTVTACPNYDPDSIDRAHHLGYDGDTWAMSRDHELAHSWLYEGRSRVLWNLAHGWYLAPRFAGKEEARVLALQAALDKTKRRPWDTTRCEGIG